MARNRVSPSDLILFKVDVDGNVIWGRKFDYKTNDNSVTLGGVSSQMVTLGDFIYFTAFAEEAGDYDMILSKVSTDGFLSDSCASFTALQIPVTAITDKTYYTVEPDVFDFIPTSVDKPISVGVDIPLNQSAVCGGATGVSTNISASICAGESFEGYTTSGIYIDAFQTSSRCDSIRTLMLAVSL